VRLVVAETDPTKGFHIIEDIKETTRLGAGVYTTGRLQAGAIEKTLTALEHMRTVAAAKNVEQIRAVGTSAVREAANRAEFLESALRRTGIDIEVLDADSEARLAFSSVVNGFDLDDRCVAVADIGGGSTELVLSTSGVIDDVYPLPLGAVRLTDLYGVGGAKGEYRYDEMAQAVTRVISERLYNTRHRPFQIIGTGGTFTSLARLANYREPAGGGVLRFSFAVGGYEFRRAQVTRLLDWLRSTPLDERKRLPGLSSARAEIIVAGVCIVEKLMQYFGVDRLRVHDGGIRDGLLL
jgi:exopolyphosphatase/guanosine-5'-triphosphate,3'-diphosphate pyrophosphatase